MQKVSIFHTFRVLFIFIISYCVVNANAETNHASYYLKVGSFSVEKNALHLKLKIEKKYKLPVLISKKGNFSTVSIGPYDSKSQALNLIEQYPTLDKHSRVYQLTSNDNQQNLAEKKDSNSQKPTTIVQLTLAKTAQLRPQTT